MKQTTNCQQSLNKEKPAFKHQSLLNVKTSIKAGGGRDCSGLMAFL